MKPVLECSTEHLFRWFLHKCPIAVIQSSSIALELLFPTDLREFFDSDDWKNIDLAAVRLDVFEQVMGDGGKADFYVVGGGKVIGSHKEFSDDPTMRFLESLRETFDVEYVSLRRKQRILRLVSLLDKAHKAATGVRELDVLDQNLSDFEVLGLSRDATEKEVKAAYRQRMKENHPDTLKTKLREMVEDVLEKNTKRINGAYKEIMNNFPG
jgi:hypothetical protein